MARRSEPDLHGLIVVDKPAHHTSHDVVARIRRWSGVRRVGHAGTLDPFATGVVVVAVGRATRVLQYAQNSDKRYLAHVVLGAETDSADVEGVVVRRSHTDTWPELSEVATALQQFIGTVEQVPPAFSAIKVDGQPLYKRARAGIEVEVPTRLVDIYSITITAYEPPDLVLDIHCGKGTYIRSIARDLGASLGTYAYCHGLRRTASGRLSVAQAWTLDELEERDPFEQWHDISLHPDFALHDSEATILSKAQLVAWYHGQSFALADVGAAEGGIRRVYGSNGDFAGVATTTDDGRLKPSFVFKVSDESEDR